MRMPGREDERKASDRVMSDDETLRRRVAELERKNDADRLARENMTFWGLAGLIGVLIWKATR